jgi:HD-GYP domain-containing protein (c-di-GMP phosphodiesterase class II)
MQCSPLVAVKHRLRVGRPLPFNVRDRDSTLLLARGQVVGSGEQLEALCTRGALVDIAELRPMVQAVRAAPPEQLPGLWCESLTKLSGTIFESAREGFLDALEETTPAVIALVDRNPDLAIFQVLRQDSNEFVHYGCNHSIHAAITSLLVAQRLGWSEGDAQRAFKAALTMNISMLELQGELATQFRPVSDEQREAIHAHPEFSVRMLELSGVTDREWLRAVAEHHETPDGKGYPVGLREVCDIAALIRRADLYTAKLTPRASRAAMAADQAGRAMFMQDPGHPMTAALVKEFGVYPPGCIVRLASGETGLVVRRGPTVTTPLVAVLSSPAGQAVDTPARRDTAQARHAIVGIVDAHLGLGSVKPETLVALAAA